MKEVEEMEWSKNLEIGHEVIDNQHKELIRKLNDFAKISKKGDGYEKEFQRSLEILSNFCLLHFATEENFMIKANYKNYNRHKEQHENFIIILGKIKKSFEEKGHTDKLEKSIENTVYTWLKNHIAEEDQLMKTYII